VNKVRRNEFLLVEKRLAKHFDQVCDTQARSLNSFELRRCRRELAELNLTLRGLLEKSVYDIEAAERLAVRDRLEKGKSDVRS
jgi:hypothetical protein